MFKYFFELPKYFWKFFKLLIIPVKTKRTDVARFGLLAWDGARYWRVRRGARGTHPHPHEELRRPARQAPGRRLLLGRARLLPGELGLADSGSRDHDPHLWLDT